MKRIHGVALTVLAVAASLGCSRPTPVTLPPRPALDDDAWVRHQVRMSQPQRGVSHKIVDEPYYLRKSRCDLHEQALVVGIVPIEYGLARLDPTYLEAVRTLFPHAVTVVAGGCVEGEETRARVKYCPRCRAEKSAWMAQHPGVRELGDLLPPRD